MSARKTAVAGVQEVWTKLHSRWQGIHADAFYRTYVVKITEAAESLDDACADLGDTAAALSKELQQIERSFADQ